MNDTSDQRQITELLIAHRAGDPDAFEKLVPLVYGDLRRVAHHQLARHRRQGTLNTTALVHETYLKLVDQTRIDVEDRDHFFAIAARAMRQIITDFARKRTAAKRGGGKRPLSLDRVDLSTGEQAEMLVAIDQALHKLNALNERLTRVFECRYFAGLSEEETARALAVSVRTVQRDWMKGKALLRQELG